MIDLLVFSAPWCGPCVAAERAGVYEAVKAAGYPVTKIDTETDRALSNQYQIGAIPTMIIRKDGNQVGRLVGARTAASLLAEIQKFV